jgi:hypothetical protein
MRAKMANSLEDSSELRRTSPIAAKQPSAMPDEARSKGDVRCADLSAAKSRAGRISWQHNTVAVERHGPTVRTSSSRFVVIAWIAKANSLIFYGEAPGFTFRAPLRYPAFP